MCEKDINKQQHCLRAFPGVPLFDDADKLAATGFADNVATGECKHCQKVLMAFSLGTRV